MRMAIWHAGNTISNILSGFLAAGILTNMDNVLSLHAWQWFFIIEGAASILVAAAAYFLLPNWPHNTSFLSLEESEMAQYRVQVSNGGHIEETGGTWSGLKEAATDPFTWLFCLMHFSLVTAQSFKDFLPSVSNLANTRLMIRDTNTQASDYEDISLRSTDNLPRPSPTICHRIRRRLPPRLHLRPLPGIILPHRDTHFL
jgi:MFS family permease